MRSRRIWRTSETCFWISTVLCAAAAVGAHVEAAAALRAAKEIHVGLGAPGSSSLARPNDSASRAPDGRKLLGRLEIPALHLSTPILDDDDTNSLLQGAGHIRGTALPGGLGNFVVAAHRDTYFRPLSGIKAGMSIRVVTPSESFTYIVDSFKIVNPDDVYVLDMGDIPQMTLITCYPFHYIGAAPQRFTVSAHLASF